MISLIDEFRIPVVKGQENLDALLMQQLLKSFDELVTVDENGITSVDMINLPNLNYVDELKTINKKRVKNILQQVAKQTYAQFEPEYKYRGLDFIRFDDYLDLNYDIDIVVLHSAFMYEELLSNPIISMNVSNTAKFKAGVSPKQALQLLLTEANRAVLGKSKDVYRDIRKSAKSIIDSGVRVATNTAKGKSTMRMSSAVDKFMLNSIDTVRNVVLDYVSRDIQPDGVEISVHFNPAVDHAPVQGHQFSNIEFNKLQGGADFEDVDGKSFSGIGRAIGTCNCRHTVAPIIVGVTQQTFSQAELSQILDDNSRDVHILDKTLSVRDAQSLARRYYKKAQQSKEASIEASLYGDNELSQSYVATYLKQRRYYNAICKALRNT